MKVILATGTDERYIQKITPYIQSIKKYSNFDENYIIYYSKDPLEFPIDSFQLKYMTSKNSNNCMQHGAFINALECEIDDVIIFTDGDILLQRNADMKDFQMRDNEVLVGMNAHCDDNLEDEFKRLGYTYKDLPSYIHQEGLYTLPCYNTGVLCMNVRTWKKLLLSYDKKFLDIDSILDHYAKQQWLISFILNTEDFSVKIMPQSIHSHGHFGMPKNCHFKDDILYHNKDVVLFRHHL